ncbi:hypothetical protein OKW30_004641 [Paraburkholderia sp. Clong3]
MEIRVEKVIASDGEEQCDIDLGQHLGKKALSAGEKSELAWDL